MSNLLRGVALQGGVRRLGRPALGAGDAVGHPMQQGEDDLPLLREELEQARARLDEERRAWRQAVEQELAALREKAVQDGHAAGRAEGLRETRQAAGQQRQQLADVIDGLGRLLGEQLEQSQDLLLAVAYEAVVKLVGAAAATPEGLRGLVAQAIASARQQERLVVRLAPDDYQLLLQDPAGAHPIARPGIELRPDPQLGVGDCVVDTDAGQLDARLSTQLAALRSVLLDARRRTAQEPLA